MRATEQDLVEDPEGRPAHAPRVLAVLVTHDGEPWLRRTIASLRSQTYPNLDFIAVDNASTDGSRAILTEALGVDRVVVAEADLGFAAGVSLALDAADGRLPLGAAPAELVLLAHDDLTLRSDAVAELVAALTADPRVAIVGPKLRHPGAERRLQSVGSTIDATGRVDDGVDPDELDQGQRDAERQVLYVSTAGMLVRRRVLDELGRLDRRYRTFRDDLDLCWRAAVAGHDTEVVPTAIGVHVAVASGHARPGRTEALGPRFLAERNTIATLLKLYSARRLLVVLPAALALGLAKVLGFVLTRRVGDAAQTLRAWAWNLGQLPATLRARRRVQAARTRSDAELADRFARVTPRVRAYVEAIVEWVAGGEAAADLPDDVDPDAESPSVAARLRELARQRPILVASGPLAVLLLVGSWPILLPGSLRGGDLAPWPASAAAFLADHVAGWHDVAGVGTTRPPSPAQALLGLLHLAVGGSTYLAPRVLLLGPILLAWVLALKAAQRFSPRRVPRVAAATAYVLSPPALAALAGARVGALVLLAVLPGVVAALGAAVGPAPARAWRGVAALALMLAVAVAFEPVLALPVVAGSLVAVVLALRTRDRARRRGLVARAVVALVAPALLLAPWSLSLARGGLTLGVADTPVGGSLWRWLVLAPPLDGMPPVLGGIGVAGAVLLGVALGLGRAPRSVTGAIAVALGGGVAGWVLDGTGAPVWAGLPLIVAAAAAAALLAIAFGSAGDALTRFSFGWRQAAFLGTGTAVAVGIGVVATTLLLGPWDAIVRDRPALPEFVLAADDGSTARVLVVADRDGAVAWELTSAGGPTMAAFGAARDPAVERLVEGLVSDLIAGRDPRAVERLGRVGVRFVVVPPGGESDALDRVLRAQPLLEPRPVIQGRVLEVLDRVPGASVVDPARFDPLRVPLPDAPEAPPVALRRVAAGRYEGPSGAGGDLLVAEPFDASWELRADGRVIAAVADGPFLRFPAVPADADLALRSTATTRRTVAVAGQLLALLLVVSLGLRPPSLGRGRVPAPLLDDPEPRP